jgi:hypothetical protein
MRILAAAATMVAFASSPTQAAPVEYVRYCSQYGMNWYYMPGTETCVNAQTGETRRETEDGTVYGETEPLQTAKEALEAAKKANEGVALSIALPTATVDPGKTFGAAINFGTFNGESAVGVGGAIQPLDGLTINGSFGMGLSGATAGGRAGINYSW